MRPGCRRRGKHADKNERPKRGRPLRKSAHYEQERRASRASTTALVRGHKREGEDAAQEPETLHTRASTRKDDGHRHETMHGSGRDDTCLGSPCCARGPCRAQRPGADDATLHDTTWVGQRTLTERKVMRGGRGMRATSAPRKLLHARPRASNVRARKPPRAADFLDVPRPDCPASRCKAKLRARTEPC